MIIIKKSVFQKQVIEKWKDVIGYEGQYQVSDLGKIKSLKFIIPKIISSELRPDGYLKVRLYKNNRPKSILLHRIVAMSFVNNPSGYSEINHVNGIKTDNRAENLQWCTRSENVQHAFDTGLKVNKRGSEHGNAKLHESNIPVIKTLHLNGLNAREIGEKFNVSRSCIRSILTGKTWSHVKEGGGLN